MEVLSGETRAAASLLKTTHVHDNDGRHDTHLPRGHGTVDWLEWGRADRQGTLGSAVCINWTNKTECNLG
jgi:hypothetical protein